MLHRLGPNTYCTCSPLAETRTNDAAWCSEARARALRPGQNGAGSSGPVVTLAPGLIHDDAARIGSATSFTTVLPAMEQVG